jgi:expansin (peptidoglycan-binding protein)
MSSRRRRQARIAVLGAACAVLLAIIPTIVANALSTSSTPTPVTGNATWFDSLGAPYGGCGLPQANLDSQNFVALNVYNTPNDYSFYPRPLTGDNLAKMGMWDNGHNCGRFVQVTISDYCTGVNDGAAGQPFCRNGSWTSDGYNGATLTMLVADSCGDTNAWCRDDPYHLDLAHAALDRFVKNGSPVGDLSTHWNNRHISWQFVPAPNYTGDINIGFISGAQRWWPAIAVSHLANGVHAVEYLQNGSWVSAQMNSDMGQSYIIGGLTAGGGDFSIRVRDAADQLINGGRVYTFSLPASCSSTCSPAYTQVPYTTDGASASPTASVSPSPTANMSVSPTASASRSTSPSPTGNMSVSPTASRSTSPSASSPAPGGKACTASYNIPNSWNSNYEGDVTVRNSGTTALTGWKVTWTFPNGQKVSQAWNANVTQSGTQVTATNVSYNGALGAGATALFGFLGTWNNVTNGIPTLSCVAS